MKIINTTKAPAAIGPYSQAVKVGTFLYLSGQIPVDPATGDVVEGGIKEQTQQVLKNIAAILEEAGTNVNNVIKTTCFIQNMSDFAEFNAVYGEFFTGKPARSTVGVQELPKKALCEVEVVATL